MLHRRGATDWIQKNKLAVLYMRSTSTSRTTEEGTPARRPHAWTVVGHLLSAPYLQYTSIFPRFGTVLSVNSLTREWAPRVGSSVDPEYFAPCAERAVFEIGITSADSRSAKETILYNILRTLTYLRVPRMPWVRVVGKLSNMRTE